MDNSKAEQSTQWWVAGVEDEYSVEKKILRTGCRPIHRELIECKQKNFDQPNKCVVTKC
jgi:hypothetical protein